ncbi:MAG: hypothetical protein KKA64_01855 [Nanoarchaeota archaeon]|nr:hypothetical protein [Nanoarchaeota archaeon]
MAKVHKFIFWTPRILAIVFILFLAMFSLDIFEGNYGFWGTILGLFMHNIPVMILLIVLIISWKHEIVGGISFILAGFLYIVMILRNAISTGFEWYYLSWAVQISGIAFFIGILFLIGWFKKNKSGRNIRLNKHQKNPLVYRILKGAVCSLGF